MATQSTKSKAKSTPKKTTAKAVKPTKKVPTKSASTASKAKVSVKKVSTPKKTVSKSVTTKEVSKSKVAFLRRANPTKANTGTKYSWNGWLALLYAVQGAAILVFSKATEVVPITLSYLANDTLLSKAQDDNVFSPAVQNLFDLDLSYAVAGLLFVLAAVHAAAVLRRRSYQTQVATTTSPFRWLTSFVAIAGVFMLVGITLGIRDVAGLLVIAGFALVSSVVALVAEELARDKSGIIHKTFLYRVHFGAYFAPVLLLAGYFAASSVYDGTTPVYVNYLFASTVVLSFALTSILRKQLAAENKWADYIYTEKAYLVTTFVLVSAVAWQIFAGVLR
jgi:Heliorhodopsin